MGVDNLIEYFKEDNPSNNIEGHSRALKVENHRSPNSRIDICNKELKREIEKYKRLNNQLEREVDLLELDKKIVEKYKKNIGKEAKLKSSILSDLKREQINYDRVLQKCIECIGILSGDKAFKNAAEKRIY